MSHSLQGTQYEFVPAGTVPDFFVRHTKRHFRNLDPKLLAIDLLHVDKSFVDDLAEDVKARCEILRSMMNDSAGDMAFAEILVFHLQYCIKFDPNSGWFLRKILPNGLDSWESVNQSSLGPYVQVCFFY